MTKDGLLCQGFGYILSTERQKSLQDDASDVNDTELLYKIHPSTSCGICGKRPYSSLKLPGKNPEREKELPHSIRHLKCRIGIIHYTPPPPPPTCICDLPGMGEYEFVAIVQLETHNNGTWFGKYLSPANLATVFGARDLPEKVDDFEESIEVQATDNDQQWCIK
jgi:hypothetical protein